MISARAAAGMVCIREISSNTHLGPNIISSISHSFLGLVLRFHQN
jgi:hypothetical protein